MRYTITITTPLALQGLAGKCIQGAPESECAQVAARCSLAILAFILLFRRAGLGTCGVYARKRGALHV